jgi:hypothetical protein
MIISDPGRGLVRRLGLAAAAIIAFTATSHQRAEALSLASPGTAPAAKYATDGVTIQVRGGHHGGGGGGFHGGGGFRGGGGFHGGGGFRGGGAAFHGGGFRGGGVAIHRGGFRAAPVFRGGGFRYSGIRYGGHRVAPYYRYHHRHHFHRRFYAPAYYDYPRYYGYPRRHCRVVWTHYGPRKICRYRPWLRHHYWRHRVYW